MSPKPFKKRPISAMEASSQEAALSLCELGSRAPTTIPMSLSPSSSSSRSNHKNHMLLIKNWTPLFENVLAMIDDIQESISEFLNEGKQGSSSSSSSSSVVLEEFHEKLTRKIYVLSCLTKMQRKVEEAHLWPLLMEQLSSSTKSRTSSSFQSPDPAASTKRSKVSPLYKNLDSSLTQIQLNLRQLHSSKKQSHHLVHDLVIILCGHCHQLNDTLLKISKDPNCALPLLVKLQDPQVNHFLHTDVLGDKPVKEITNELYVSVCRSGSRNIKEMVKLIQNLVKGSYMEAILDKGKWSSLFKFGQETSQMMMRRHNHVRRMRMAMTTTTTSSNQNNTSARPVIRINNNNQQQQQQQQQRREQVLQSLKRKLVIDYSNKTAKKLKSAIILSGSSRSRSNSVVTRPPSKYYKFIGDSEFASLIMDRDSNLCMPISETKSVPQFSVNELEPTFHKNNKLGCAHYARRCKLRHPKTGRLYTCRLCDEVKSPPLDRFAVKEILCMQCNTLQPSGTKCINPDCVSKGTPFARYSCLTCNLFDDDPNKDIFHCPDCNVCRLGKGLGIDFKHCNKCDACISIDGFENHKCTPKRLKQKCSLCLSGPPLGQSTEPIQSMSCGHTFHSSCFNLFTHLISPTKRKCPICRQEDEITS